MLLTKPKKFISSLLLTIAVIGALAGLAPFAEAGNDPLGAGADNNDFVGQKPNPGTAWFTRWLYFLRNPVAREAGPKLSASDNIGQDVIQNGQSLGPSLILVGPIFNPNPSINTLQSATQQIDPTTGQTLSGLSSGQSILQQLQSMVKIPLQAVPQNPTSGPVFMWPKPIPFYITNVPTNRDRSITYDPFQTFGYPVSDTQFQIIQRYNDNRMLEQYFDPERWMWLFNANSQLMTNLVANNTASLERNQSTTAIDKLNPNTNGWFENFTVNPNNVWNNIRNQLFMPMAVLLLLTGAVATQARAIVAQGTTVLGDINPWEGILRSIVAIFLIPATYLVVNYGIDVNNSITKTIMENYSRVCGGDMFEDAKLAQTRAFSIRNPSDNRNAILTSFNPQGQGAAFPKMEMGNLQVTSQPADPNTGIQAPGTSYQGSADEDEAQQRNGSRAFLNIINADMASVWNVLNAFQIVYMLYLWCLGPIAAALWVWPMQALRSAFPSWVEGVVTLSFWSLFWNTTVLLMACFKNVDDTGSIIMSALNWLSIASVQYAFAFSDMVSAGGQKAAGAASQGMAAQAQSAGRGLAQSLATGGAGGQQGIQNTGAQGSQTSTTAQGGAPAPGPGGSSGAAGSTAQTGQGSSYSDASKMASSAVPASGTVATGATPATPLSNLGATTGSTMPPGSAPGNLAANNAVPGGAPASGQFTNASAVAGTPGQPLVARGAAIPIIGAAAASMVNAPAGQATVNAQGTAPGAANAIGITAGAMGIPGTGTPGSTATGGSIAGVNNANAITNPQGGVGNGIIPGTTAGANAGNGTLLGGVSATGGLPNGPTGPLSPGSNPLDPTQGLQSSTGTPVTGPIANGGALPPGTGPVGPVMNPTPYGLVDNSNPPLTTGNHSASSAQSSPPAQGYGTTAPTSYGDVVSIPPVAPLINPQGISGTPVAWVQQSANPQQTDYQYQAPTSGVPTQNVVPPSGAGYAGGVTYTGQAVPPEYIPAPTTQQLPAQTAYTQQPNVVYETPVQQPQYTQQQYMPSQPNVVFIPAPPQQVVQQIQPTPPTQPQQTTSNQAAPGTPKNNAQAASPHGPTTTSSGSTESSTPGSLLGQMGTVQGRGTSGSPSKKTPPPPPQHQQAKAEEDDENEPKDS